MLQGTIDDSDYNWETAYVGFVCVVNTENKRSCIQVLMTSIMDQLISIFWYITQPFH